VNNQTHQTSTGSGNSPGTGYTLAITSSVVSGLTIVIGKWNLEFISPLLLNFLIFSIATVLLSIGLLPFRGIKNIFTLTRKGWFWLSLFAVSSWVALWAFWAGVQRMDPSLATFLNRSEVMVTILLGMIFLKERFNRMETLGLVLSIAGIVIMRLTLRMEYSTGFYLVLLGSLFFGITEFVSKIAIRYVQPVILAYIRNMFMAVMFWIVFSISGQGFDGLDKVWLGVLAVGFTGPILARLLYLSALKRMELSKVAVISQSQPVYVILIAALALGQLPTIREITGGIFLTIGCLLMIVSRPSNRGRGKLK